ncbi:nitrogenase-stabilizing/protective protein NifW [Sulfurospirillum barnesii]|uniref:Nitrogenase-stabilizing/protective protein NifW n=1 Tax=Sulfurospirillum barnesii (strain ATCC 700032 / DSM 10660 / SES-3) TaxID=760154 RepID=I3XWI6_SULBS|nr:nitrogenase-stabilizing/protective protein NifW [Sulfurospirillum barnesii]AFL68310.1 Nitrogen fixation protein NifW [Sulfurospirillum barnesii SES-3]
MKTLEAFYRLKTAEDYFEFFSIEYDKNIVAIKRFHIMKEYGTLIKKGFENFNGDEKYLMDFLKFALIRVYMDYKHGHAPSAAEVWGMIENGEAKGCLACALSKGGCDG